MNIGRCVSLVWIVLVMTLVLVPATVATAADHGETSKTVLVTGANRGLGLEFARQYSEAGWSVIGTARQPEKATELRKLDVRVMQLDVTDPKSVARLASDLGDLPLDMLINNAGVANFDGMEFEKLTFDGVERTIAVNTLGPMRVTRALLPHLRRGGLKNIVHITSGIGCIADNDVGGYYGYRESKAALNMFNRSLAMNYKDEG
ncbi:MAG: SDR family oxidoreductase, partial [Acidobacteriota bacterium]